jgi:hypothetical protein
LIRGQRTVLQIDGEIVQLRAGEIESKDVGASLGRILLALGKKHQTVALMCERNAAG